MRNRWITAAAAVVLIALVLGATLLGDRGPTPAQRAKYTAFDACTQDILKPIFNRFDEDFWDRKWQRGESDLPFTDEERVRDWPGISPQLVAAASDIREQRWLNYGDLGAGLPYEQILAYRFCADLTGFDGQFFAAYFEDGPDSPADNQRRAEDYTTETKRFLGPDWESEVMGSLTAEDKQVLSCYRPLISSAVTLLDHYTEEEIAELKSRGSELGDSKLVWLLNTVTANSQGIPKSESISGVGAALMRACEEGFAPLDMIPISPFPPELTEAEPDDTPSMVDYHAESEGDPYSPAEFQILTECAEPYTWAASTFAYHPHGEWMIEAWGASPDEVDLAAHLASSVSSVLVTNGVDAANQEMLVGVEEICFPRGAQPFPDALRESLAVEVSYQSCSIPLAWAAQTMYESPDGYDQLVAAWGPDDPRIKLATAIGQLADTVAAAGDFLDADTTIRDKVAEHCPPGYGWTP